MKSVTPSTTGLMSHKGKFYRVCPAEFPHAWIKERCGLRQFREAA